MWYRGCIALAHPALRDISTSMYKKTLLRRSYAAPGSLVVINEIRKSTAEPVLRFLEVGLLDLVVYGLERLQQCCHFIEWPGVRSVA